MKLFILIVTFRGWLRGTLPPPIDTGIAILQNRTVPCESAEPIALVIGEEPTILLPDTCLQTLDRIISLYERNEGPIATSRKEARGLGAVFISGDAVGAGIIREGHTVDEGEAGGSCPRSG